MLKVYIVRTYVSIDGGSWWHIGCDSHAMRSDDPTEIVVLDDVSFDECFDYLNKTGFLEGVVTGKSLFRRTPLIYVYDGGIEPLRYKHFNSITYKHVYEEWDSVSLDYIMKHFPANKCIMYLKERGMTICPYF